MTTVHPAPLRLIAAAIIIMTMLALLSACGDPKAQPPAIVVTFDATYSPPPSLDTGEYAGIAADVANDTGGSGQVNWSCLPSTPAGACGTFSPPQTGSTTPTCYLAPAEVPTQNPVTVTATSVDDPTKSASATITIVSGAGLACP
jgi:ABC-type amino acid transport substrate-binding protein